MKKLCDSFKLPSIVQTVHVQQLWSLISKHLMEEFSQVTPVNEHGRETMARDIKYLIKQSRSRYPQLNTSESLELLLKYV